MSNEAIDIITWLCKQLPAKYVHLRIIGWGYDDAIERHNFTSPIEGKDFIIENVSEVLTDVI